MKTKRNLLLTVMLFFTLLLSGTVFATENDSLQLQAHKEAFKWFVYYREYDPDVEEYFITIYDLIYEDIYQMEKYEFTDKMGLFLDACTYFTEIMGEDTNWYTVGFEGLEALDVLADGYTEDFQKLMNLSRKYYDELLEDSMNTNDIVIGAGIYIIGEDIPAGKYDINAINGSGGTVCIYKDYQTFKNDGFYDDCYWLYAEDYRYYGQGKSSTASNIRLEDGECVEVNSGLELRFASK